MTPSARPRCHWHHCSSVDLAMTPLLRPQHCWYGHGMVMTPLVPAIASLAQLWQHQHGHSTIDTAVTPLVWPRHRWHDHSTVGTASVSSAQLWHCWCGRNIISTAAALLLRSQHEIRTLCPQVPGGHRAGGQGSSGATVPLHPASLGTREPPGEGGHGEGVTRPLVSPLCP